MHNLNEDSSSALILTGLVSNAVLTMPVAHVDWWPLLGLFSIWAEIFGCGRMFVFFLVELHINSGLITSDLNVINGCRLSI